MLNIYQLHIHMTYLLTQNIDIIRIAHFPLVDHGFSTAHLKFTYLSI